MNELQAPPTPPDTPPARLEAPAEAAAAPAHPGMPPADAAAPAHQIRPTRLLWFLAIPAVLIIAGLFTTHARGQSSKQLATVTQSLAVDTVSVLHGKPGSPVSDITLPGMTQAFSQSPIYARVSGYVRAWHVDIGTHVRKGQLLAEIDAPEVDQELNQARAMVGQVRANLELARITAERYQDLIKTNSVSQQEVDQNNQNLAAQQANLQAAIAAVGRLEQMQGFEKVYAPFDGVITARKTDIGDLINAGNSGVGRELFHISQISTIRVFVNVPEEYSKQVRGGAPASMDLTTLPGKSFSTRVTRTSNAIDPASRTLSVELDVPNASGELLPGAYANVHFKLPIGVVPLVIPTSSILFQAAGPQIGIVGAGNQVQLRKVTLGHDFGDTVEVLTGLTAADAVIANPSDSLTTGTRVAVDTATAPAAPAPVAGAPATSPGKTAATAAGK
jgi:RND family efflux transporter MFP subunit